VVIDASYTARKAIRDGLASLDASADCSSRVQGDELLHRATCLFLAAIAITLADMRDERRL